MNLIKNLKILFGITILYSGSCFFSEKSSAISGNGEYVSAILMATCYRAFGLDDDPRCLQYGLPPSQVPERWYYINWWLFDPPVSGITSLSFDFYFNPNEFTPITNTAGFFCSFTNTGNCPTYAPGVNTEPIQLATDVITPGSALGTSSINIGSNSVSVDVTFSSPITGQSEDEIFFGLAFQPLFEVTRNTQVTYSRELLPNASYSLSSFSCTTLNGQNQCGSDNFTRSFRVEQINEPRSLSFISLLALGTLGAASTLNRKQKPSKSTQKELTKVG